uniref:MFS domain-containing protein n=2 Tax=Mesocestoides corti TaxID=53468 RepID=A0A5K3F1D5_MESCO
MSLGIRRLFPREMAKRRICCFTTPTVYHAAVVIFLEFFAFGLLTSPMISVLDEAFPKHTFLMNGLIQGVKGFLSFLSAPLIGALSDILGRKPFLFLTVTFTCSPIPFIKLSHWWYFTMISISGIFSVTFSVVLAFVSDVTTVENRSWAYGLVSATFAASLIVSPSLGAFLEKAYSENFVIVLASLIAFADIVFILFCVPESLESSGVKRVTLTTLSSSSSPVAAALPAGQGVLEKRWTITWDKVDPFGALRHISRDRLTLLVCMTTFLSYLPEAGEYSCFFVYLRLVIGFSEENVALFIALCGLVSCFAQTCGLGLLITCFGSKHAIIVGLAFEACQLAMFGFFSSAWVLWSAGCVAGLGSITYPALSAFLSNHVNADQQGLAQGLLTGIRGLCGGLGPAVYGFIFFIFQVNLNNRPSNQSIQQEEPVNTADTFQSQLASLHRNFIPGPPFAFGAVLALLAIMVAIFIPEDRSYHTLATTRSTDPNHSLRRSNRAGTSSSTANLLAGDDVGGYPSDADDDDEHQVGFAGLTSPSTDRRRRVRDNRQSLPSAQSTTRHQRQPSASKIPRGTVPNTFFQAHATALPAKLANPLRRLLANDVRHAPSFFSHLPSVDPQRKETEAADLANFRVPTKFTDEYAADDASDDVSAPLIVNTSSAWAKSSTFTSPGDPPVNTLPPPL